MDDMQQKLNAILSNQEMMQQLMGMAQSLGQSADPQASEEPPSQPHKEEVDHNAFSVQGLDIGAIQRITGLAQQAGVDTNQKSLLKALAPYLSHQHILKLEKAMRAAKLAEIATTFLGSNTLFSSGR